MRQEVSMQQLHTEHGNYILDVIRKLGVSSVTDAADIRQEFYMKVFEKNLLDRFPDSASLRSYIYRAIKNAVVDFHRTCKRENAVIDWVGTAGDIAYRMAPETFQRWQREQTNLMPRLLGAVEFLESYKPAPDVSMSAVIEMVYIGEDHESIAETFNVTERTVYRWLEKFRQDLEEYLSNE